MCGLSVFVVAKNGKNRAYNILWNSEIYLQVLLTFCSPSAHFLSLADVKTTFGRQRDGVGPTWGKRRAGIVATVDGEWANGGLGLGLGLGGGGLG